MQRPFHPLHIAKQCLITSIYARKYLVDESQSSKTTGIRDGYGVEISSKAGKGTLKANLKEGIREDMVYMLSGFGVLSKGLTNIYGEGACMAEILEDYADEISGNMALHETLVKVTKFISHRQ